MANIVWPSDLEPSAMEFYIEANTAAFASPFTRQERVLERPGSRWIVSMTFDTQNAARTARIDALLASMKGRAMPVELFDFRRPTPAGSGRALDDLSTTITEYTDGTRFADGTAFLEGISGQPRVGITSQTGDSILTTGWAIRETNVLKAGDYVEFGNNRLHMVTEDATTDFQGQVYLRIAPPVVSRNELIEGTLISIRPATGLFRLQDDRQGRNRTISPVIGSYSVNFVEVIHD